MQDILIYGAGGFGREIACMLNAINQLKPQWKLLGFLDDGIAEGTDLRLGKVLGNLEYLNNYPEKIAVVIAVASPEIIKSLVKQITNPNVWYPNLIAPDVNIFDHNSLKTGKGNVVFFGGRLSCDVEIGDFNLLNSNVSLGHDVKLGSYNVLGPNTRISGNSLVGNQNFFGVYSVVLQGIKIGQNTRIGANSVVIKNTKDHNLYFGNPAKRINQ